MTLRAALVAFALLTAPLARAEPVAFKLDPEHTTVAFWVDHIGFAKTLGWFTKVTGDFTYDAEAQEVRDISVAVDAASVFTNNARRDGHVKSKDFVNAEVHPVITFTAAAGEVVSQTEGVVTGELTLLGVTKTIPVTVRLNKDEVYPFGHKKRTLGVSASATLKRSDFGMTYALGGIVGDEVTVQIEVEAIAQD